MGYHRRPDLTAERFRRLRLDDDTDHRIWYRSGDIARRLPDGTYVYLRRDDWQVNLRGFRIEQGEVEVAMRSEASVREAVAMIEEVSGESILVMYAMVDGPAEDVLAAHLRQWCVAGVPAHMAPNRVVLLSEIPLSPSGKVDRARLRSDSTRTAAAP